VGVVFAGAVSDVLAAQMRTRYVQIDGELIEIPRDYTPEPVSHYVMGDIEPYESPASGEVITSRSKRREDFKRTGTREWEGLQNEKAEIARQQAYEAVKQDQRLEKNIHFVLNNLSERTRRALLEG
jgi:hypothetical protein